MVNSYETGPRTSRADDEHYRGAILLNRAGGVKRRVRSAEDPPTFIVGAEPRVLVRPLPSSPNRRAPRLERCLGIVNRIIEDLQK